MEKNIKLVDISGYKKGVDFQIVSRFVMKVDKGAIYFMPLIEGMDMTNVVGIVETEFDSVVENAYDVGDNVNIELATKLGLGVMLINGKQLIYNSFVDDEDSYEDTIHDEMLRVGVYYQLTNPKYPDRKLEQILDVKGGAEYIESLMYIYDESIVGRLKEIFNSQKGGDNVVPFKKE